MHIVSLQDSYIKCDLKTFAISLFLTQIPLVNFLIKNFPRIFGEHTVCYETSLLNPHRKKTSGSLQNITDVGGRKEIQQPDNRSHSGMTCPTDSGKVPRSPTAPIDNEGIICKNRSSIIVNFFHHLF